MVSRICVDEVSADRSACRSAGRRVGEPDALIAQTIPVMEHRLGAVCDDRSQRDGLGGLDH
jgi:hypothetical protein